MNPAVVSIVSKKNSGKTTLLEKLIPELKRRGYRVGTIKHDTHGFDIDHEGKDTYRHKQAGAETVVISSPWKISVIKDVTEEVSVDDIVEQHFQDMDIVLTEGYKRARKPQIEVFRSKEHREPIHSKGGQHTLVAVVSDTDIDLGVPRFDINDVPSIADFIERTFIRREA
ncbi:MAG: molybdopterin-guanine dinucleotide biosynthesis protein B [Desulfobacterales bacterium]